MTFSAVLNDQQKQIVALATQQVLVDKLESFSIYSDRITCVLAPAGAGKTTILSLLLASLPTEVDTLYKDCHQKSWYEELLNQLNISGSAARHSFQFGIGQIEPKRDLLLVLDNADSLSLEQIERLAEKAKEDNFHCIMAMNDASPLSGWFLDETERVIPLSIEQLTDEECVALLAHALNLDESQLLAIYDEKTLDNIILHSRGIPGKIITQAQNLEQRVVEQPKGKSLYSPLKLGLTAALMIVFLFVLWFQDDINRVIAPNSQEHLVANEHDKSAQTSKEVPVFDSKDDVFLSSEDDKSTSSENSNSGATVKSAENEIIQGERAEKQSQADEQAPENPNNSTVASSAEGKQNGDDEELSQSTSQQKESKIKRVTETQEKVEHSGIEHGATVTEKTSNIQTDNLNIQDRSAGAVSESDRPINIESKSIEKTENQHNDSSQIEKVDNSVSETKIETGIESNSTEIAIPTTIESRQKSERRFNAQEKYLLSLPKNFYFIQLAGFSSIENVSNFIEKYQNAGALHFYRSIRNDSYWYVVVLGPYEKADVATQALEELPNELKKGGPWIKSLASIQDAIEQLP